MRSGVRAATHRVFSCKALAGVAVVLGVGRVSRVRKGDAARLNTTAVKPRVHDAARTILRAVLGAEAAGGVASNMVRRWRSALD